MQTAGLHWFRRKQRALSRLVLAAFCLTWLQFAVTPCVMALDSAAGITAQTTGQTNTATDSAVAHMPDGMAMAPGEHCRYCPPATLQPAQPDDPSICSFPHDPQVDSRVAFATALLAPPPALVLFVVSDASHFTADAVTARMPAPASGTSLAVSLCRFLE